MVKCLLLIAFETALGEMTEEILDEWSAIRKLECSFVNFRMARHPGRIHKGMKTRAHFRAPRASVCSQHPTSSSTVVKRGFEA